MEQKAQIDNKCMGALMKKTVKKINLPAILTLILGLGILSGSFAQRSALAGRIDTVPAIQVTTTKNQIGRYLHVIYAVGRPAFLNVSPIPYVDIVRPQSQTQQISSEVVVFPAVQIEKTPGRGSYNMVIFAISNSAKINWINADVNPNPTEYKFLGMIQKPQIDAFMNQDGIEKVLLFNF